MKERERTKDFEDWLKKHEIKDTNPFPENRQVEEKKASTEETNSDEEAWAELRRALTAPRDEQNEYQNPMIKEWIEKTKAAKEKKASLTKGAYQAGFYEKMQFPLCPEESKGGLDEYAKNLQIDKIFAVSENGQEYTICSIGWTFEWNAIQVKIKCEDAIKKNTYVQIKYEDGVFVHVEDEYDTEYRFCGSPNVLQCGARVQCYFPLCPKEGNITLEEYANILQKDVLFETNNFTDGYVIDREITKSKDGKPILYVGVYMPNSFLKKTGDLIVFIENGKVIHQIGKTYFNRGAVEREFCFLRGQKWEGEVFDDYC